MGSKSRLSNRTKLWLGPGSKVAQEARQGFGDGYTTKDLKMLRQDLRTPGASRADVERAGRILKGIGHDFGPEHAQRIANVISQQRSRTLRIANQGGNPGQPNRKKK